MENKTEWRPGPTVCRCCLAEGCYKDISTEYFWMGKREVYAEMLADTLDLTIGFSSSGPYSNSRLICEPCITRLRDASDFKRQVQECEKTFMQHLNPDDIPSVDVVRPLETVKVETVKCEVAVSDDDGLSDVDFGVAVADDDDDDDDDELDNEPLTKLASKVPKKEKDIVDLIDLADNIKATEKRKSTSKAKAGPAKKAKTAAKADEPVASASTASASKVEKKKKGARLSSKNNPIRNKQNRDASILVNNSNVILFKWKNREYMCFCCRDSFLEMTKLRAHSEIKHTKTEFIEEIYKRYSPVLPKADITNMACQFDSCQTEISTIQDLIEHLQINHNILLEGTEVPLIPYKLGDGEFRCQICDVFFRYFKSLNNHMNKHFSGFICSTCGVGFQHKFALRSHELRHNKNVHKCLKCQLIFPTSYKQLLHYYTVHKKGGRYGCPHCDEKFMDYEKRQNHLAELHGYQRPSCKCLHCTKTFKSPRLLQQHVRKVVNKQNDALSQKMKVFKLEEK